MSKDKIIKGVKAFQGENYGANRILDDGEDVQSFKVRFPYSELIVRSIWSEQYQRHSAARTPLMLIDEDGTETLQQCKASTSLQMVSEHLKADKDTVDTNTVFMLEVKRQSFERKDEAGKVLETIPYEQFTYTLIAEPEPAKPE